MNLTPGGEQVTNRSFCIICLMIVVVLATACGAPAPSAGAQTTGNASQSSWLSQGSAVWATRDRVIGWFSPECTDYIGGTGKDCPIQFDVQHAQLACSVAGPHETYHSNVVNGFVRLECDVNGRNIRAWVNKSLLSQR